MKKHVSVVIPTIDEPDELRECFECLLKQTYNSFDILVVDSGSGVNQSVVDEFSEDFNTRLIEVPKNGLPRARNIALSCIEGSDIIAFCDPDARPVPDWISALASEYEEGVGAVGGPVLNPGQSLRSRETVGVIQSNGEIISNFDADCRRNVEHLRGTNMSFEVNVLREVGGFDPAYEGTAHFEDTDATYNVYQGGYDIVYTPKAAVEHHHPEDKRDLRSYYYYMIKNWPILFEKTDPRIMDRIVFHMRRSARSVYYKTYFQISNLK